MEGVCCAVLFVVPVVLLISAGTFQGGCALYNRFVGQASPERVPQPTLGRAMGIQFLNLLSTSMAGGMAAAVLFAVAQSRGLGPDEREFLVILQLIPLGLVIAGAIHAGMLPTTFARGLLVALCHALVCGLIALGLGLCIGSLALLVWLGGR
jgi:hypothetical protein